jgi:spore coat protein A
LRNRRYFLRALTAGGVGLFVRGTRGQAVAQIPGGTLNPLGVPKYQTPMLIPPVMPTAGKITDRMGKNIDYYEISVKQFAQQILPAGFPVTTVWGYGAVASDSQRGLLLHNAPSLTIEAKWRTPVRVKWINDLVNANGNYLPHLLPVDQTLHWANPSGGVANRDTRPTFRSTPGRYTGPVPIVTHVHGAVGVGDESDGYAEAWYLPAAVNIPASYATEGTWYSFFAGKSAAKFGTTWGPGFAVFQYPNDHRASTIWYHDHALGMTRLNVYAGPAGFYLIRGGPDGDDAVLDSRFGTPAVLPGPAPKENDQFPPKKAYYEIPIAIQDRSFNADGSLFYPNTRALFDGIEGPFIPIRDNLCPLSAWVELSCFREDLGESIGELIETVLRSAVRQRTTEHLDGMLGEQQRIDDTVQTTARRNVRGFGLRREVPGLRSGQMKLSLQIGSNNVDIAHRHLGIDVAE